MYAFQFSKDENIDLPLMAICLCCVCIHFLVMCNEMAASTSSQETRYRVIQDAIRVLGHVVDTL